MAKYLDENGLLYFWQKIKNLFAQKSELPGVVSKTSNGLAPQLPNESTVTKFLRQDGSWQVPPGIDTTATQSADGLMSSEDKTKLDGFGAASSYALKTDITGMYKYKGSVATASALPSSGQSVGDVYNIEAASTYGGAGMNVAWDGTAWDPLGEIFSITSITNGEIDTVVAN